MRVIFDPYLQLARIEAAEEERLSSRIDLKAVTAEMVEAFALIAEDERQSVSFEVETGQDYGIRGEAQMLQQMVVNLLQNAVTHGEEGNIITVALSRSDGNIRFTISDPGAGIPAEFRESMFEPFHPLDPSRSKPGSGLGLALVRAIVEKHSGHVAPEDNRPGLIVEVTLPAR